MKIILLIACLVFVGCNHRHEEGWVNVSNTPCSSIGCRVEYKYKTIWFWENDFMAEAPTDPHE